MSDALTHSEAEALWPAYDGGRTSREENRALHLHLKDCEVCRARVRTRRLVSGVSRSEKSFENKEIKDKMAANRRQLLQLILLLTAVILLLKIYTK